MDICAASENSGNKRLRLRELSELCIQQGREHGSLERVTHEKTSACTRV